MLTIRHVHKRSTADAWSLDSTPTFQNANNKYIFSLMAQHTLLGQNHLHDFPLSHSDTPHSVGLLWASDGSVNPTTLNTHERHSFEPATPYTTWPSALKHTFHFSNKGAWATEGTVPVLRNLDNRWEKRGQLHASADLVIQDRLRMTATRRLAELQGRSGPCTDERISRSSRELRDHTLVTTPTELARWYSEVFPVTVASQIQVWIPVPISVVSRLLF